MIVPAENLGVWMYAVLGTSEIDADRGDEATAAVTNGILPRLSQAPGFVSATFVRTADGTGGRSMVLFESEEAAKAMAASAGDIMPDGAPIKIISIEVAQVVASG